MYCAGIVTEVEQQEEVAEEKEEVLSATGQATQDALAYMSMDDDMSSGATGTHKRRRSLPSQLQLSAQTWEATSPLSPEPPLASSSTHIPEAPPAASSAPLPEARIADADAEPGSLMDLFKGWPPRHMRK